MRNSKFEKIREEIKRLSTEQVYLKDQRKTVHIFNKRTIDPYEATLKVSDNGFILRHLFLAYAKMKGIKIPVPTKKEYYEDVVEKYCKEYAPKEIKKIW